jgi:hypothetical protein
MSQFRNSPILNIQIHDRDERENTRRCIGSVFGSEYTDEIIGKVSSNIKEKVLFVFVDLICYR